MTLLEKHLSEIPSPCYVVEETLLRRNLALIAEVARRADVEIILAFKAFALWRIFPIFREYISHTTASSLYEARLACEEFGSKAHTYSPAYVEEEFEDIVNCSDHLTFNSLAQFRHFAPQVRGRASIGLRVNPEYSEIETLLYNPCAPGSRFGILADDLPPTLPEEVEGFHIHCHCESDSDAFVRTLSHIEEKFSRWFSRLKWINFGGGHLMTRRGYDTELLVSTLRSFHARYPWLRVILEPGSAFAWQTGPLVARVVDIVENSGVRTAIVNTSFTCHMPDCLEMPYQPAIRHAASLPHDDLDTARSTPHAYRIGGNSCLSGDFMGLWQFPKDLSVGDTLLFDDMIHYTGVKTTMFNGISHPSVAMLRSDGTIQVLRRFGYEDYRDRMC